MITVNSTRFGNLKIQESELINFPEGILGFETETNFCIVDPDDSTLIMWLQSTSTPNVCFPIIEPNFFTENSNFQLPKSDLASLELSSEGNKEVYNILTIPSEASNISANMKAPIVVNTKTLKAKQIVLQDNKLSVNENIYDGLKQSIAHYKSTSPSKEMTSSRFKTINL